jgi:hypothetical protein
MPRQRRKAFRVECNSPATIHDMSHRSNWPCSVSDFSDRGVRITGVLALAIPDEFVLCFDSRAHQCRVRWRSPFALGAEFTDWVTNRAGPPKQILEAAE